MDRLEIPRGLRNTSHTQNSIFKSKAFSSEEMNMNIIYSPISWIQLSTRHGQVFHFPSDSLSPALQVRALYSPSFHPLLACFFLNRWSKYWGPLLRVNSACQGPWFPMGFPCGAQAACNAEDPGSILGSRRFPGEGNGNPLQYACLGNPMHRGAGGPQSMGLQRVRHNRATNIFFDFLYKKW